MCPGPQLVGARARELNQACSLQARALTKDGAAQPLVSPVCFFYQGQRFHHHGAPASAPGSKDASRGH